MLTTADTVIERYGRLRPGHGIPVPQSRLAELSSWLEHDVCALVDELCQRVEFRAVLTQTIKNVLPGSNSATRTAINDVDASLVNWAKSLADFASLPPNRSELLNVSNTNAVRAPAATLESPDDGQQSQRRDDQAQPLGFDDIVLVAARPWRDLVSAYDFFRLSAELNLVVRDAFWGPGAGTLLTFSSLGNPQGIIPGNHLVQGLFLRIEFWDELLQRFYVRCHTARSGGKCTGEDRWKKVQRAAENHTQAVRKLRGLLIGTKNAREDSAAMALIQVYADYGIARSLEWLPVPLEARTQRELEYFVVRRGLVEIPTVVCGALCSSASLIDRDISWDVLQPRVVDAFPLVVVALVGHREVYWRGEKVDVDWVKESAQWIFMIGLVEGRKKSRGVDSIDCGDRMKCLRSTRSRLGKLLPESLDDYIKTAGEETYRLDLAPHDIALVRHEEYERLFIE